MRTQTLILDGIWGHAPRWESLRRRVEMAIGPCEIYRYNNTGLCGVRRLGEQLAARLAALQAPFHIVGYSMGGLVAREAIRQQPSLPIQRAAFLHSPHKGSLAAALLPLPAARDMMPGSPVLRDLEAAQWTTPTLATWCPYDLMVLPGSSAAWSKASEILRLEMPAHAWPVFSRRLHERVVRFLSGMDGKTTALA